MILYLVSSTSLISLNVASIWKSTPLISSSTDLTFSISRKNSKTCILPMTTLFAYIFSLASFSTFYHILLPLPTTNYLSFHIFLSLCFISFGLLCLLTRFEGFCFSNCYLHYRPFIALSGSTLRAY